MRMQVNDARHQREAAGIDDLGRVFAELADRDDPAVPDGDIGAYPVVPEPVEYYCSADHGHAAHSYVLVSSIEDKRFVLAQPDAWSIMLPWIVNRLDQTRDGSTAIRGFNTRLPRSKGERNRAGQRNPTKGRCRRSRRGQSEKPVGAVVAAAKVLRILHGSERPLNASEVARAAGLHRGTAYNILRTLQAEGFVGYDEPTRSYSVSLHILELAYGVLRRIGLMDLARPLMHAISDAHGVSVYLSKVLGPSSLLLLDWVGVAFRTDL